MKLLRDKNSFAVVLLILSISILLVPRLSAQSDKLVWSDEFNGTALDTTKWTYEIGNNNGWGNNELEYYTNRVQNCSVQNGLLTITARHESFDGYNYTSARIITEGKFSFEYGKVEARIKLPYGKGIWPAFWMLGDNITQVGWPACGENDIMEMIGGSGTGSPNSRLSDSTVYGTLHWKQNGSNSQSGGKFSLSSGRFADAFHIFGVTWTPQKIQFFVDSTVYYQVDITPAALTAFHSPFFIILNLAVGGNWPGNPDSSTFFPQTMEVDYVRVYQDTSTAMGMVRPPSNGTGGTGVFALDQNYPNPFNPATIINYSVSRRQHVILSIYNILGQKLLTLVNRQQRAGAHSVMFDGENYSSGVYYCMLTAVGNRGKTSSTVRKILLLK